jgi:hypothetical protein
MCQEEHKATAGYWYRWLDEAFGKLSGRLPFKIIDTNNVTASPNLPFIDRPLSQFKSLSHIVRGRHMVEFKKRYGLEGSSNGLDVTHDWSPTMTPAWGLPILMDPRLNGIPNRMGLVTPYLEDYKRELHEIHYEWYKRARDDDVVRLRATYDAENVRKGLLATKELALRIQRAGKFPAKTLPPCANMHMGFEPDSDEETAVVAAPLEILAPPEIPLLCREVFLVESVESYRAYKQACKMLPWAELYPDPKYKIGVHGACWQELLYEVELAPVWKALDALNRTNQFRFFPIMARYSKASVYKLQASSFCERVNSAGKIVFSDSNLSMASEKVEQRTMLRMNKKWMAHMRKNYPDCTADVMVLLRKSHEALAPILPECSDED